MALKRENAAEPRWDDQNQRWILQVQVDGKRRTVSSRKEGRAGIQECKRKLTKLISQSEASSKRVKDVWPKYLEDIDQRKGKDSNSRLSAEQIGRANILPVIGNIKIDTLTEQHLQNLLNNAKKQNGEPYSKKTVSNIRGELVLFAKYLRKSGASDLRPTDLELPSKLTFSQSKDILQRSEVAHILRDRTVDPYLMSWQIMLLYGFRPGEVYGLQWTDIGDDKITIKRSVNVRGKITPGKNKNAQRTEYLLPQAREVFARAQKWQKSLNKIVPWVFPTAEGTTLDQHHSVNNLTAYCRKHNLTRVTPYRLRHTFVSLAKTTLTEAQIKMTIGHSEAMDTGIYMHRLDDDHLDTGKALTQMFEDILA